MRRCHVSLDVTLISRHCKPMLLLHGEQVEFPAPTKAELGLQNGHSPKVESFGEWWDIQDDCDHGTSSKPSQLRSERSRRTAADNLGAVFLEGRIEHLLRVYQKKWLKMIPMDRHILYLLSIWEWYIHIYIYRVRRSILTSWGRHKSKWVTLKPSLTPSPTCRRSRLLSPYEEGLYKKHVGTVAWLPCFEQMFLYKFQVCLLHLFVEQRYFWISLCVLVVHCFIVQLRRSIDPQFS